jgi:hypothetical protein
MPAYITLAAKDFKSYKKGDILSVAIEGKQHTISSSGNFVGVEITGATGEQVKHFTLDWQVDFSHTLNSENAFGWQFIIEVDPAYISMSNVGKAELKDGMQDHINNTSKYWEGSTVVGFTSNSMTVNIPKNGPYQTANGLSDIDYLKKLKRDFSDIFKTRINPHRYHFSEADVDIVLANGGTITVTKEVALNKIIDKLDE